MREKVHSEISVGISPLRAKNNPVFSDATPGLCLMAVWPLSGMRAECRFTAPLLLISFFVSLFLSRRGTGLRVWPDRPYPAECGIKYQYMFTRARKYSIQRRSHERENQAAHLSYVLEDGKWAGGGKERK